MLDEQQVRALRTGDTLYSNAVEFVGPDGNVPGTATVLARPRKVGDSFVLKVRREYGAFAEGTIGKEGWPLWRTQEEKTDEDEVHVPEPARRGGYRPARADASVPAAPVVTQPEHKLDAPTASVHVRRVPRTPRPVAQTESERISAKLAALFK